MSELPFRQRILPVDVRAVFGSFAVLAIGFLLGQLVYFYTNSVTAAMSSSAGNPETSFSEAPEEADPIQLLFVGDMMPSRFVAQKLRAHGYDHWMRNVSRVITSADLAIANLESPVTSGRMIENGEMVFRTDPEFVPTLQEAGFDVMILANNHTPNWGQKGLIDTFSFLASSSIVWVGAGTSGPAYDPQYLDVSGLLVAIIAQNDQDVVPPEYCASEERVGTACFDMKALASSITEAKERGAFVVASMHSGTEYSAVPNRSQRQWAQAAATHGADLIIGHHPHVIQPSEVLATSSLVYWSLGNFLFDQSWSKETKKGLLLQVNVDPRTRHIIDAIETVVLIEDNVVPTLATTTIAWKAEPTKGALVRAGNEI